MWFTEEMAGWYGGLGGGIFGSLFGAFAGVLGAVASISASKGNSRRLAACLAWMRGSFKALFGVGVVIAPVGITALIAGQPWHVWFVFLAFGGGCLIIGILSPRFFRAQFRQLEDRCLRASGDGAAASVTDANPPASLSCGQNAQDFEYGASTHTFFTKCGVVMDRIGPGEWVSRKKTLAGTPYVHVNYSERGNGHARGLIAVGARATGLIAAGGFAKGLVAFGGGAVGVVAFGGGAIGLLAAVGGGAASLGVAIGGGAIGAVALGGGTIGCFWSGPN